MDQTLCVKPHDGSYADATPNREIIQKLNHLRLTSKVEIILYTSRNMRTYNEDISKINLHTIPVIVEWCAQNKLDIDGIIVGKPYGGQGYFFIDDRSIRPAEFLAKSISEIEAIMDADSFK